MKIQFWGAVRTVTGSMHLVEADGMRILLDCGLYQGKREEAFRINRHFPFDPASIDCAVLSHAHIDHSGNLPTLCRKGFKGNIYATPATRDLCSVMLLDSAHIQESDIKYVNKKREKKSLPLFNPLYTKEDAEAAISQFVSISYNRPLPIGGSLTLTFVDAGHILGSASVILDLRSAGGRKRLVFSGDLGRPNMPIIRDPAVPDGADHLIMESTYGSKTHEPMSDVEAKLADAVGRTIRRGGKVVIPAFSVGRTQQVVYFLHRLIEAGQIPPVRVYVDSPLSANVSEIFRLHPECYDAETKEMLETGNDPLGFELLTYIRHVEKSKELQASTDPSVIISASGMCEVGRVLHHLKSTVENAANTVLMVGHSAPNTLGRRIMDGASEVKIFGEEYRLRAEVAAINALSAHADSLELIDYVKKANGNGSRHGSIKSLYLVHGEEEQSLGLAHRLKDVVAGEIVVPTPGEVVEV